MGWFYFNEKLQRTASHLISIVQKTVNIIEMSGEYSVHKDGVFSKEFGGNFSRTMPDFILHNFQQCGFIDSKWGQGFEQDGFFRSSFSPGEVVGRVVLVSAFGWSTFSWTPENRCP